MAALPRRCSAPLLLRSSVLWPGERPNGAERGLAGHRNTSHSQMQTDQNHVHLCRKSFARHDEPCYPPPYRWEHQHWESGTPIRVFFSISIQRSWETKPRPASKATMQVPIPLRVLALGETHLAGAGDAQPSCRDRHGLTRGKSSLGPAQLPLGDQQMSRAC